MPPERSEGDRLSVWATELTCLAPVKPAVDANMRPWYIHDYLISDGHGGYSRHCAEIYRPWGSWEAAMVNDEDFCTVLVTNPTIRHRPVRR